MPIVSVVMAVYNTERFLDEAIESVLAQTFRDFELIIVNDGSSDASAGMLSSWAAKDSRIKIVTNEKNIGLTLSLVKGVGLATGEYIARMDADDRSRPERFERQIAALKQNPKLGCVGSNVVLMNEVGQPTKKLDLTHPHLREALGKRNRLVHGSLMFRRSALEAVGGYSSEFVLAQDYDLLLRLSEKYEIAVLPEVLYELRRSAESLSSKKFWRQLYFTALAKFRAKERTSRSSSFVHRLWWVLSVGFRSLVIYKFGLLKILRGLRIIR